MIVCAYEYDDGICGITEEAHDFATQRVARRGHTFTGAEVQRGVDVKVDADGVARFIRPLKAGQTYIVPADVLAAVMQPGKPKCVNCGDDHYSIETDLVHVTSPTTGCTEWVPNAQG